MSIRQQIEDAQFLFENGRHLGALTVLMLAIAGSSRRMFPEGTPSLAFPKEKMRDGEAFKLFLGGRLRQLLLGDLTSEATGASGVIIEFGTNKHSIEHILYKYYRCGLVHESQLPREVAFRERPDGQAGVGFLMDKDRLTLDTGWIQLLLNAVVHAPINAAEFQIAHYELTPKGQDEATLLASIGERYGLTIGRIAVLKHVVKILSPAHIAASDDVSIKRDFLGLVDSGALEGRHLAALATSGLTEQSSAPGADIVAMLASLRSNRIVDDRGELQDIGVEVLRQIASAYRLVQTA